MPSPNHRSRASLASTSTGAAIRRGDLKISDPIPFNESRDMFTTSASVPSPGPASAYQSNDTTWQHQNLPPQEYHHRHVSEVPINMTLRNSAGPSLIPSSMSSVPSKSSMSQKKPGGLRATLKRMFTGRKHRSVPAQANNYHYSDPGQLLPVSEQHQPRQSEPPQAPGHAIPGRALTSHSVHSTLEQNLPSSPRRGRRNTLPSLVFSDKDLGSLAALTNWAAGESTQQSKRSKEDCVSDGQLKRRSRSADQLNEALRSSGVEPSPTRDRASEIAYWRNSAIENPVPVYSGQSIAVDPVYVTAAPVSSTAESERASSSAANPMQAFDFGLDLSNVDDTSLEQRINTLEIKLIDFEYAIAKLQGTKISNPVRESRHFNQGPMQDGFPNDYADATLTSVSSQESSYLASSPNTVNNMSFLSSPGDSPSLSPEREDLFRPQRSSKATTATITPYNSKPKTPPPPESPTSIHIPLDKFEALLEMVKDEKAARLRLEEQVMELQKEVEILRTPVYATIREAPYPTPSPESSHHNIPATPRVLHRSPGFQLNYPPPEISRFSGTDQESENEQEEGGFEEVYETPLENSRKTFETARDDVRLPVI
ncbi:uncharacterized protein PV06_07188 [Exophiala oligosperma]|uniref:Uncharacterized protein n=1 Tax=Exophiala oligosperma TaxID=215243 RepID=A0A0D2ANX7_9EURO|nr:uncharacterized protein PV06_07188 [Exophiala oligosperma]KIW41651.1 hypothetical protein PV06_07188 [Exophiala oligosperma]